MNGPRCCGLHHTSYCPEMRNQICTTRHLFQLDPEDGKPNEEKIEKIKQMCEDVRNTVREELGTKSPALKAAGEEENEHENN